MTLGITIDVNGTVIEHIVVENISTEAVMSNLHRYRVTEIRTRDDGSKHSHTYRKTLLHRRSSGALHLAAKVCDYLSYERRKR